MNNQFDTDEDRFNYSGELPGIVEINGKPVEVFPNQNLTIIDDKGNYEITDTVKVGDNCGDDSEEHF